MNVTENIYTVFDAKPNAKLRLLCFPYAGGSANIFRSWGSYLTDEVELVAVQLPGRGRRLMEPPHSDMKQIVDELIRYSEQVTDLPLVIFGHSLGGCVAFEFMKHLDNQRHTCPKLFICSASRPPQLPSSIRNIKNMSDKTFIDLVRSMESTPKEILGCEEMMALLLPMLKADFTISEQYRNRDNRKFSVSCMVLIGSSDRNLSKDNASLWNEYFHSKPKLVEIQGGHFFIHSSEKELLTVINRAVDEILMDTSF